jgi:hypothetical protein
MIRTIVLGLMVGFVLIASPSSSRASFVLVGDAYHAAYCQDDPDFANDDVFVSSFPAAGSLSADIGFASGAQTFSYTQSGYVTAIQSTCSGYVSGPANDSGPQGRYGEGFFYTFFSLTTDATYSYSMSVTSTGTADEMLANLALLDFDTGFVLDVYDTSNGTGTLFAGHTYVLFGTVYAVNHFFEISEGGTGSISADMSFEVTSSPAPEPASVVMLGLGVVGMAGYGWRRRKIGATA